jgi:hypothetical protein
MLSPTDLNKLIERVVGIFGAWLDTLVAEVDGLLSLVAYFCDIASRIVEIALVLHLAAGPASRRLQRAIAREVNSVAPGKQARQAEGQRVVCIRGDYTVTIFDPLSLAFCVIVDILNKNGRRFCPAEIPFDAFEEIRFVIYRSNDAVIGQRQDDRAVQRVEVCAGCEDLRLQGDLT